MSDNSNVFQNEKQVLMYYHTTLRNIGLFTSVALAALFGSTNYLRGSKGVYKLEGFAILIVSIVFLVMTLLIGKALYENVTAASKNLEIDMSELLIIPNITFYMDSLLLVGVVILLLRHLLY